MDNSYLSFDDKGCNTILWLIGVCAVIGALTLLTGLLWALAWVFLRILAAGG